MQDCSISFGNPLISSWWSVVWQVIDPEMPRAGVVRGGVTVQAPPEDVLKLRQKYTHEVFLVVFYDTKRTW